MTQFARLLVASAALSVSLSTLSFAGTLAYWRFEGDGVNVPTVGTQVEDSDSHTTTATGVGIRAIDSSGNGNTLWAWEHDWAGHTYQANVPGAVVPKTGAANSFSVQNAGGFPALGTWSEQSNPTFNIQNWAPTTWSMEVSFNLTSLAGWQTFVGRDGNNVRTGEPPHAPFYFQKMGDGTNRVRVAFVDTNGVAQTVTDPVGVSQDQWYNYAVTSDGTSMKLLRQGPNDNGAYTVVGTTNMTPGTKMVTPGHYTNGDLGGWAWTVGRGSYGTGTGFGDNHGDRVMGYLDEVRFSDTALATSDLLWYTNVVPPTGRDIIWTGSQSGTWDASATNFTYQSAATAFVANDRVTINNNSPSTITLSGSLAMGGLVVNAPADLTFDGDGSLNGSGGLTKNGAGTLLIRNTAPNGFAGTVTINAGAIELTGDGTASPMLGSGEIVNNGTLVTSRTNTLFISNNISGTGSIVAKANTVLSGNNTFSGNVSIENGTLFLDSQNALGNTTGTTTVLPGGQLGIYLGDFNFTESVSLSGTGVLPGGAIRVGANRSVTFSGPMALNSIASVEVDGGSTLKFTGNISPTSDLQFYKGGGGVFETKAFNAAYLVSGVGTLRVVSGGAKVNALQVDATLDMTRGALAVDYSESSPFNDLLGKLTAGNLINSLGGNYAVALVDNAARTQPFTTLAGVSVDATSVLIRGTLKGDTNLDGAVTFDDLLVVAQFYDLVATGRTWDRGDNNYDGIVNFDDLLAVAQNYGLSALSDVQSAQLGEDFVADFNFARSLVPEPTSLLAASGMLLLRRRRS